MAVGDQILPLSALPEGSADLARASSLREDGSRHLRRHVDGYLIWSGASDGDEAVEAVEGVALAYVAQNACVGSFAQMTVDVAVSLDSSDSLKHVLHVPFEDMLAPHFLWGFAGDRGVAI